MHIAKSYVLPYTDIDSLLFKLVNAKRFFFSKSNNVCLLAINMSITDEIGEEGRSLVNVLRAVIKILSLFFVNVQ